MRTADSPIHLIVVGGGLCGLAAAIATRLAGHRVTVLDSVAEFREVGAGLQITPNGTRLLQAWGLSDMLSSEASAPEYFRMRRFDGRLLAERTQYGMEIGERHGAPLWCLHRADLQMAMAARAEELGVVIKLGCKVTNVDPGEAGVDTQSDEGSACVTVEGGEVVKGDLILAADGIWSDTRHQLTGLTVKPKPTGDLAYRILLDREYITNDKLKEWLSVPGINIWVGPEVHAVAYSIKGGRWLNLVLLVKDDLPEHVMRAEGDLVEMKTIFQDWDPILVQFLEHVAKVDKWRLNYLEVLPVWKSDLGRFLLAGDCAHPMLPYMAQGANSALEDGATVGALLSKVRRQNQIPAAVTMYDSIRRPRIEQLVRETFKQGKEHHLPDGPEQIKRDLLLSKSFERHNDGEAESPPTWTHPKLQPWIYGYDAYAEVEKMYNLNPF